MARNGRLRIGVLYDYGWGSDETPGPGKRPRRKRPTEDIAEVYRALEAAGHAPVYLRLDGTPESLQELAESKTDLVFNLVESFAGDDTHDRNVAGYLELLGRPFTGAGSRGLGLAQDKPLAKKVFAFHGIRTPRFATVWRGRVELPHDLEFPVIVKPAREDGSIGIGFGSVCGSIRELVERLDALQAEIDGPALIEQYVEGREVYVGVLGNDGGSARGGGERHHPRALKIVELDLSRLPDGTPRVAGREVKWEEGTEAYEVTRSALARGLDDEVVRRLHEAALTAYRALHLRDYGRVDFRLGADGEPWLIEVNPNPYLLSTAELAMAARAEGVDYDAVVAGIVEDARRRYGI